MEWDQAAIQQMLTGSSGPVVQYVQDKTKKITDFAKLEAPARKAGRDAAGNSLPSGDLKKMHEYTTPEVMGTDVVASVRAYAPYAIYVHEGTNPHEIRPKAKKALAFTVPGGTVTRTTKTGKTSTKTVLGIVITLSVHHPGTKKNQWLYRAAQRAGLTVNPSNG